MVPQAAPIAAAIACERAASAGSTVDPRPIRIAASPNGSIVTVGASRDLSGIGRPSRDPDSGIGQGRHDGPGDARGVRAVAVDADRVGPHRER